LLLEISEKFVELLNHVENLPSGIAI